MFRYFFLLLFLGFFISNSFFDHTHIYDGNIIVHSHPFKHQKDDKPLHNHNESAYLLINLLNHFIAKISFSIPLILLILFLSGEIIAAPVSKSPALNYCSPNLLRGPPSAGGL